MFPSSVHVCVCVGVCVCVCVCAGVSPTIFCKLLVQLAIWHF